MAVPRINKEDLKKKLDVRDDITLLDVRNPADYGASDVRLPGAVRIPLDELEGRVRELDPKREVVAYCT